MTSKDNFWDKYYQAKKLSAKEFSKKKFNNMEMVIFALLVAIIISFTDDLFVFNRGINPSNKTMFLLLALIIAVCFYRIFLLQKNKKS